MTRTKKKNQGCLSALFDLLANLIKRGEPESGIVGNEPDFSKPLPFRLRDDFLSTAEHSFYMVLKSMMSSYFTICPKVSLSDIFFVTNPDRNMSAYNRINRKHVDFLICDAETMKPRFAIELDDKSHNRQDRKERDEFVEELFETANLPLVRIPVRPTYNTNELGVLFRGALMKTQKPANQSTLLESIEGRQVGSTGSPTGEPSKPGQMTNRVPFCPKCGQQMVLRTSQNGANKGKSFYGCVNYPKCNIVIPVS